MLDKKQGHESYTIFAATSAQMESNTRLGFNKSLSFYGASHGNLLHDCLR